MLRGGLDPGGAVLPGYSTTRVSSVSVPPAHPLALAARGAPGKGAEERSMTPHPLSVKPVLD
jgi:hypothetical protein